MFILDSLLVSGVRWVLDTVATAADAELNDETALREMLLEAEERRDSGKMSADEFADIEADLITRIAAIKANRDRDEGRPSGPITFEGGEAAGEPQVQVEATISGDFHDTISAAESGTAIEGTLLKTPRHPSTNAQGAVSNVERRTRRRRTTR